MFYRLPFLRCALRALIVHTGDSPSVGRGAGSAPKQLPELYDMAAEVNTGSSPRRVRTVGAVVAGATSYLLTPIKLHSC